MLKLHFKDARQAPVWLTEERLTLGQDSRNTLQLTDAGISAFHAEIRQEKGLCLISDCGSQSGTYVNEERVGSRYQLRSGDVIRLGSLQLDVFDPIKVGTPAAQPSAAQWFLFVLQGEHEGSKYPVTASLTFGRSSQCELCFANDHELSRRHCEFFLKDGLLHMKDLGSANGVLVNQSKLATAQLQAGDQLKMGSVSLLVIGPKVQAAEQDVNEDATVFMQAVKLPRPVAKPQVSQVAAVNPARAQAAAATAVQPAPGKGLPLLLIGAVLIAAVAIALWVLLR
jgi:pSer/pThr/pTyr-binding forkhead associated (FHA) protein